MFRVTYVLDTYYWYNVVLDTYYWYNLVLLGWRPLAAVVVVEKVSMVSVCCFECSFCARHRYCYGAGVDRFAINTTMQKICHSSYIVLGGFVFRSGMEFEMLRRVLESRNYIKCLCMV